MIHFLSCSNHISSVQAPYVGSGSRWVVAPRLDMAVTEHLNILTEHCRKFSQAVLV
jgi:hypothetical protein